MAALSAVAVAVPAPAMARVGSWGRTGTWPHVLRPLHDAGLRRLPWSAGEHGLAYGMGRSYGDVCLNPGGVLWTTRGLDRFIAFDAATGVLRCEAGVLLRDIQRLAVPRGWMLPVTPGTGFVTVGGAIANDVHGKNHHALGTFGDHVHALRLLRTSGEAVECGPSRRPEWFQATVGGLGLTGVITEATLQLRRVDGPWLDAEEIPYESLDEFFALADGSERDWEYTVSWVDCAAGARTRGIFMRARHAASRASAPDAPASARRIPWTPPVSLVNGSTVRAFNWLYHRRHARRVGVQPVHYQPFFCPLDHVLEWNRIYGPRGFYQYQCVLPREAGRDGIRDLLAAIAAAGDGSFLAVLKTFGDRPGPGLLSFARPGVTLALDFPNRGAATERLFTRLDAIVLGARGRLYPAKDGRMGPALFAAGFPRLPEFLPFRDPGIRSAFARRVLGD